MRLLLKVFALLDVLSILFLVPQIWAIMNHFNTFPQDTLSIFRMVSIILIFLSLFISAWGLFFFKKFGLLTYYVQFVFRLVLFVYTVGFVTFLPELFKLNNVWFLWMFRICVTAEFFRLYYTIKVHRSISADRS